MGKRAFAWGTVSSLAIATAAFATASGAWAQDSANPAPAVGSTRSSPGTTGIAATQGSGPCPTAPAPAAGPNNGSGYAVDTIVVTAQKRTENLQDVPVVVTVVNKQLLQDAGIRDIKDLSKLTPGLTVTSTSSEAVTTARIRGVGTVGDNPGLEPSVGVTIDGVYRPRNGVGFGDLGDVDQIEVLKGPQGSLFGKSTSAGVINIQTTAPSFKFGSSAEFTAGNYGAYGGSAEITGPLLNDTVAASLYVADRQRDGFYKVDTGQGPRTSTDDQNQNFYTIRGQLLFKPESNLTARIIADYTHRDERCCVAVQKANGSALDGMPGGLTAQNLVAGLGGTGGGEAVNADPYNRQAYANQPDAQDIVDEGVSAQIDYKFPSLHASLTSITAFRNWKVTGGNDLDFSNADLLVSPEGDMNSTQFQDFSQELRFAGTYGKLDYLVGGFYANEYLRDNFSLLFGNQFSTYLDELFSTSALGIPIPGFQQLLFGPNAHQPAGDGGVDSYRQRDDDYAIFTNETLHVTSKLEINAGIRYTIDNKVLNSLNQNIGNGQACTAAAQGGGPLVIGQAGYNTICLPFESPAFNYFPNHQSESTSNTSGTVKAAYRFSPEVFAYASYAKGFKAGGFNLDRTGCPNELPVTLGGPCPVNANGTVTAITADANTFFKPEYSDSGEVGVKTTLFNRKLILNGTLFYEKFSNFQYNTFTGLVFVVDSLPYVYSKGLDADFVFRPIRDLLFQGGLTVADTRFSHSDGSSTGGVLATSGFLGAAGARLPFAPVESASLSATYTYHLPREYMVRLNAGAKFNSQYNTGSDEDPRKLQPAYTITDGRIIFGPENGQFDVEVWGENLFDTHYEQVAFDSGFQNAPTNATGLINAFLGAPRTFGVTLRAKY
jgi:iron complex outermembrane receptor protein